MRRLLAVSLAAAAFITCGASTAAAHTGFDRSEPANGTTVDTPVETIDLIFTGAVEPTGEGFVALDPSGTVRTPETTTRPDENTFRLGFDPPLAGGTIGVRWTIASGDGHPISDSFSFTVTAAAPTTTTSPPASTTSAPDATSGPAPDDDHSDHAGHTEDGSNEPVDLESFLDDTHDSAPGTKAATAVLRSIMFAALLLGIGALTFALVAVPGDATATATLLRWIGRCGPVVAVSAIGLVAVRVADLHGEWSAVWDLDLLSDTLDGSFGVATALRVLAGLSWWTLLRAPAVHSGDAAPPTDRVSPATHLGALAGIVSFSFVGHTVSEGPRWLHSLVDVVHVTAAGVWIGGVASLVMVARRRAGDGGAVAPVAARFSVLATGALVAVAAAGVALGVIIADEPGDLWGTGWGRLLIVKVAVVAIAAVAGGYNHRVVVPALTGGEASDDVARRFRHTMSVELACFAVVIVLTALLVAMSP